MHEPDIMLCMKHTPARIIAFFTITLTVLVAPVFSQVTFAEGSQAGPGYVALGDSVAAGAGLPVTDPSDEAKACGRSAQGYPALLAPSVDSPFTDLACGGATVMAGIMGPQTTNGVTVPAQIDRAFEQGVPKLITISIGTNDVNWSNVINKCYSSTCGTWQDTRDAAKLEYAYYKNLHNTLETIKRRAENASVTPHVILVGYYKPVSNQQPSCGDTAPLTSSEISWIRAQVNIINGIMKANALQYGFADYAPVDFSGHEFCSAQPWVQGLGSRAPFHPNAAGQAAIAQAILAKLHEQ